MKKTPVLMFLLTALTAPLCHADSLNLNLNCKSEGQSEDVWEVSVSTDLTSPNTFEVDGGVMNHPSYKSIHFVGQLHHLEGGYIIDDASGDQFMYFNNEWSIKASDAGLTISENLVCE